MSLMTQAFADGGAPATGGAAGGFDILILLALFGVIFYFMIYRPQSKRVKEHKSLMDSLAKGDEVLTSGGLVGKITKIPQGSDYIALSLNDQTVITMKRDYVTAILPKGSIQTL